MIFGVSLGIPVRYLDVEVQEQQTCTHAGTEKEREKEQELVKGGVFESKTVMEN